MDFSLYQDPFLRYIHKGMSYMEFIAGEYDVIVIGAGHAGIEASLASARLKAKTAAFTMNLDWIGNIACNPSIGGASKGHLVREIDALGGEMGHAADATLIQSRMLNRGKGPAVHSIRAQIDRKDYSRYMKRVLETQEGLDLMQSEIVEIRRKPDHWLVVTKLQAVYSAKCVIIATGTFLRGKVYVGDVSYESGPDGTAPSNNLSDSFRELNIPLRRFKTGTPARVNKLSVDFSKTEPQPGDEKIASFSFEPRSELKNKALCHICYTNERTKQVIIDNIHRSPLYSGQIEGIGPRYCPSVEDKIMRFPDKKRHQVFIEPCGMDTQEVYLSGLSSSLPLDTQFEFLKTLEPLKNVKVLRNAYAIEYDCADPLSLKHTLEFIDLPGLYGAGQFNGSSGYEEAAAQGLIAGINAAHSALGKASFTLDRTTSYIGTLIDDLVTKGCSDPYRMMTSRSEYRLILRQDNADSRLTPYGYELGLISEERYSKFISKMENIDKEKTRISNVIFSPTDELNQILESSGTSRVITGVRMIDLLKRPQIGYELLSPLDINRPDYGDDIFEAVEIEIKYEGYIKRQNSKIKEALKLEKMRIPSDMDYKLVAGLKLEAQEKLNKIKPENIGQASRISGVTPADISVLLIYFEKNHIKFPRP